MFLSYLYKPTTINPQLRETMMKQDRESIKKMIEASEIERKRKSAGKDAPTIPIFTSNTLTLERGITSFIMSIFEFLSGYSILHNFYKGVEKK